jgi:hypothetical protein|tara:strand:- start:8272 stop:8523 length:252 start_codon:yes stop_codon:yes gene_type:complete
MLFAVDTRQVLEGRLMNWIDEEVLVQGLCPLQYRASQATVHGLSALEDERVISVAFLRLKSVWYPVNTALLDPTSLRGKRQAT